ncbi:putative FecCD-family membrane transport protein [Gordonia polyisoprenivorans VH2]|uniref:Putative FecCD-family membrane transport protein n=1 Tax=Gordonia polyisoprenivorans (strain DSM 44266 / VH2) TaxID=1112204 RepID=H6MW04_GORPV|nr:iron chelate uptake ABC transporter family permease subunit [Gordonia polyisoprenivorans]AFA71699.1 putative FecCD-family membrane transport protein [Gordonia polyisoprenivorans VH2]OZC33591.1 ABC transporter permease [Gordonia polyisoprenivorans]QUD82174.1 iron chelate uptake ABC transporter family permease subunit [Gordonia polyisoprenivorans]
MTATLPRPDELVWPVPRMRIKRRGVLLTLLLAAIVVIAALVELASGPYFIPLADVAQVVVGGGDRIDRVTVLDWRMPRVLVGLGVGVALGAAGAITQSLARNPLASPDLLGVSMGASAAAVTMLVLLPAGLVIGGVTVGTLGAAFLGGILVSVVITALAYRGGLESTRLVLIGVGVNALASAVISLMLVQSRLAQAADVVSWLTGSLEARTWGQVVPLWITIGVGMSLIALAAFDFRVTHLGDAVSRALGVPVRTTLLLLWIPAVVMTAATVAAAGPITFVALAAPQLARLLYRSPTPPVIGSALVAAALVLYADLLARYALGSAPVGIVTSALGAPFLLVLLIRVNRKVTV